MNEPLLTVEGLKYNKYLFNLKIPSNNIWSSILGLYEMPVFIMRMDRYEDYSEEWIKEKFQGQIVLCEYVVI